MIIGKQIYFKIFSSNLSFIDKSIDHISKFSKFSSRNLSKLIPQKTIFNKEKKDNVNPLPKTPKFRGLSNTLYDLNKMENELNINKEEINKNAGRTNVKRKLTITKDRRSSNFFKIINSFDGQLKMKDKIILQTREKTLKFGYFFGICYKICKAKNKSHLYDFLRRFINDRMDVTFYLKTLEKFDRVRVLLFNYYQNLCLDFTKIPNLSNKDELSNYDMDLQDKKISHEEIVEYFNFRIMNKEMDECDQHLLNIVAAEIKNLVMSTD